MFLISTQDNSKVCAQANEMAFQERSPLLTAIFSDCRQEFMILKVIARELQSVLNYISDENARE